MQPAAEGLREREPSTGVHFLVLESSGDARRDSSGVGSCGTCATDACRCSRKKNLSTVASTPKSAQTPRTSVFSEDTTSPSLHEKSAPSRCGASSAKHLTEGGAGGARSDQSPSLDFWGLGSNRQRSFPSSPQRRNAFWEELASLREENELLRRDANTFFLKTQLEQNKLHLQEHLALLLYHTAFGVQSQQTDHAIQVTIDRAYQEAARCLAEIFDFPAILLRKRVGGCRTAPPAFEIISLSRAASYVTGCRADVQPAGPDWTAPLFIGTRNSGEVRRLHAWLTKRTELLEETISMKKETSRSDSENHPKSTFSTTASEDFNAEPHEALFNLSLRRKCSDEGLGASKCVETGLKGQMLFSTFLLGSELLIFGIHSARVTTVLRAAGRRGSCTPFTVPPQNEDEANDENEDQKEHPRKLKRRQTERKLKEGKGHAVSSGPGTDEVVLYKELCRLYSAVTKRILSRVEATFYSLTTAAQIICKES